MSDRDTLGRGPSQLVRSRRSLSRVNLLSQLEVTRMTVEARFDLLALWPLAMALAAVFCGCDGFEHRRLCLLPVRGGTSLPDHERQDSRRGDHADLVHRGAGLLCCPALAAHH